MPLLTYHQPASLGALSEGRFVDTRKVVCPHGGIYSWDTRHDTCTCSLHNRLKYLTPNAELSVLKVSRGERTARTRGRTCAWIRSRRSSSLWKGWMR